MAFQSLMSNDNRPPCTNYNSKHLKQFQKGCHVSHVRTICTLLFSWHRPDVVVRPNSFWYSLCCCCCCCSLPCNSPFRINLLNLMSRFVQSQCWTFQVFSRSLIAQFDHNDIPCLVWPGLWKVHEVPDEKTLFENLSDNNAQFEHMNYKLQSCCHSLSQKVRVLKKGGLKKGQGACHCTYK